MVQFPEQKKISPSIHLQTNSAAHLASPQWVLGAAFPMLKQPRQKGDYSHPHNAEFKKCVQLYFHSHIRIHGTKKQF
jgi:hypothetical protein